MKNKNRMWVVTIVLTCLVCLVSLAQIPSAAAEDPPESRPFRLGFTRWPPELSLKGIQQVDRFIDEHADLVSIMFIGGVPWPEALAGEPFSQDVRNNLSYSPPEGYEVFLSISPLDQERKKLAPYWGENDNQPLPAEWAGRGFDDAEVTEAFTKFVLRSVEALEPDYLAIGIESNVLLSHDREAWEHYKGLHREVYRAVKKEHPTLPVCFTTEINHYLKRAGDAHGSPQEEEVAELMTYSDIFAMSYYPHMSYDTPWPVPEDTFGFARRFEKPIAISETGMSSREVNVFGLTLRGNPKDQKQYYEVLLRSALRDDYLFVVTFATTDFEKLAAQLPDQVRDLAMIWAYTGLQTSAGDAKPALDVWDRYLKLPLSQNDLTGG